MKNNNLHKIKSTGFKAPKKYFESFDEKLLSKLNAENKLEDIKTTGFNVPKGYFKTLDKTILNAIEHNKKVKVIPLFSWKKTAYISAVAASLILMFNVFNTSSESLTFDTLEMISIENYLVDENFTNYELAALLTEDELNIDNFISTSISESILEDYLLDNITIEDLLIE